MGSNSYYQVPAFGGKSNYEKSLVLIEEFMLIKKLAMERREKIRIIKENTRIVLIEKIDNFT